VIDPTAMFPSTDHDVTSGAQVTHTRMVFVAVLLFAHVNISQAVLRSQSLYHSSIVSFDV